MIALLAASATAPAEAGPRTAAHRQASATVRILAGARITDKDVPDTAIAREARVSDSDGDSKTVRLIEFP